MSYDLAIWKRSPTTKTAMLQECYEAILEDTDHIAMDFFDQTELIKDFEKEYGTWQGEYFGNVSEDENANDNAIDDCPFLFHTGQGKFGNWFLFHLKWSAHQTTTQTIINIALKHSLMVYDPQRACVWGNKRPPK